MARGDQIYVMRPLVGMQSVYEHHGIDCGDGTVIHYSKAGEEPTISRTPFTVFSWGNPIYTKRYTTSYIPDVTIERAESRLGERNYNLLNNNCEHFATWCKIGRSESPQLANYGIDIAQMSPIEARRLMDQVSDHDPAYALAQMTQAQANVSSTRSQIQTQLQQVQADMHTWDRVAQLALKQQREDLARAALERKVQGKRQVADLQQKLEELAEIQASLERSRAIVQRRVTTDI